MSTQAGFEIPQFLADRIQARRSGKIVQAISVSLAVVCIAAAGALLAPMNQARQDLQLVLNPNIYHELPPDIALLSTSLGTFRGLLADILWIRSEKFKEQGKYYELMQLASWICKLQPRFPAVWQYNAWNMAYNVSVATYTPEQRWQWVLNGAKLLRDEGIPYNPRSVGLYKELAWIFLHKMGDYLDDYHWDYKREWGVMMQRVFGEPIPQSKTRQVIDDFKKIVHAPRDLDAMIASDPAVAAYVARLDEVSLTPDVDLLDVVARHVRQTLQVSDIALEPDEDEPETILDRQLAVLEDPKTVDVRDRLLAAVRSKVIRRDLRMDLDWMLILMERYGPLDWRTVYSQALYWASYGDQVTRDVRGINETDQLNNARFVFHAVQSMAVRGRMVLDPNWDHPNWSFLDLQPDNRFVDAQHEMYLELGKLRHEGDPEYREGTAGSYLEVGHYGFLQKAIRALYFEGDPESVARAQHYYDYLRGYNRKPDGSINPDYRMTLHEFVMAGVSDALVSYKDAAQIIDSLLFRSFYMLAAGQTTSAIQLHKMAGLCWAKYMEDKADERVERRRFNPLPTIRRDSLATFIREHPLGLLHKARLWRRVEIPLQRAAYDRILPAVTRFCAEHNPPLDVAKAFPEPPGMQDYRQAEAEDAAIEPDKHKGASEGTKF